MLSIVRHGPKMVFLGSDKPMELESFLLNKLKGEKCDFNNVMEIAKEDNTVVFITVPGKKIASIDDIISTSLFKYPADKFFSDLINLGDISLINDSHIAPDIFIMRILGDYEKIIESIYESYSGETMDLVKCIDIGHFGQTILAFTESPLNKVVSKKDIKEKSLLLNIPPHIFDSKFRNQALRHFSAGLKDTSWYDLQIRIYDRNSNYKLHYERLSLFLDALETTMVLGESWGKDYPRFLLSVLVYNVRLFTLLEPSQIKRYLLGLEYLSDGVRIADLDLYFKNKKVDWPEALGSSEAGLSRMHSGLKFREEVLSKLPIEDREKFIAFDEELRKLQ